MLSRIARNSGDRCWPLRCAADLISAASSGMRQDPADAKPVAAFSALRGRKKPSGVELFDDVERRDDARAPACPVGHKRFLVESAIVENNGIRTEQIAEEMQGRHGSRCGRSRRPETRAART